MTIYLQSTAAANKEWRIECFKPQGRPAYAYAIEGEVEKIGGRVVSFATIHPGSRNLRVPIEGMATAKRKAAAIKKIVDILTEANAVAPNQNVIGNL